MIKTVGIGDIEISDKIEDVIITHALASCIGITVYDKYLKVGGMIHIALPNSKEAVQIHKKVGFYVDTGIPAILNEMKKNYGCKNGNLEIRIFGGAKSLNGKDIFNIGKRNLEQAEKYFNDLGLAYNKNETGEYISRTIKLYINNGTVEIYTQPISI